MKSILILIRWLFWTLFALSFFVAAGIGIFLYELSKSLPKNLETELHKRNEILPTVLYDREGNQIEELFLQRRVPVAYERFPTHLIQALIASEDIRFFSHIGIDPFGIFRAFLANLEAGTIVQGASTLTQQTAREFLLTKERQIIRKLREVMLAFRMEMQFNKTDILELYLNKVFLGNAEGVEASSQGYFGKHTDELNLSESALLIGLLPAPSRYAPHNNPELALFHRNRVLKRMLNEKFITLEEYNGAIEEPIKLIQINDFASEDTSYYVEHVRRVLLKHYGRETLYQGGLKVKMAMDLDYQIYAHEALQHGILALTKRQGYRGPIQVLDFNSNNTEMSVEFERILSKNRMVLGSIAHGIVKVVEKDFALIDLGEVSGVITWKEIATWQNAISGKDHPIPFKKIEEAIKPGYVIPVKIIDYDPNKNLMRLQLYQEPLINGGVLGMQPKTGHVLTMIGGYQYQESEFNRAIQAKRQPGSSFKPIVYAAAVDAGYTLSSILVDSPRAFRTGEIKLGEDEIWLPKNYGDKLMGSVTMRTALVKSLNLATISLIEDLGPERVIEYSRKMGITAPMRKNLTIALGSFSATLQDMINVFSVFANEGKRAEPIYILEVSDQAGNILESAKEIENQIISKETSFLISNVLQDVVKRGTGWRARAIGRPSAGKTGTTNNNIDAWYIGFIPQLLTGVYVGFDQPRSMGLYESGSKAAAPIWVRFMKKAVSNLSTEQFPQPPGIITVKIHESGRRANSCDTPEKIHSEHYKNGTEPAVDNLLGESCSRNDSGILQDNEKEPEL